MAQINKPNQYFNTKLYTGDSASSRAITGIGFEPSLTWNKPRTTANDHQLVDAVRGGGKVISSNLADAEYTAGNTILSFNSDGFTCGDGASVNANGVNYASWNWKANGAGVSNTDGSITSTVSANTTSGFSIVSYTGTGSNATVGHGLGAVPKMIITKNLQQSNEGWQVYHETQGNTKKCALNETGGFGTDATAWNSTTPTNNVFYIGTNWGGNGNGHPMIAYCFAEKKGFSKFGSYTGNGSTDGTFTYTGFKPAFLLTRKTTGGNWQLWDNKRDTINPNSTIVLPNANNADVTTSTLDTDFLSNGFKQRNTDIDRNGSGTTYIYMAFAENPLVGTNNIPATAR
jgi:hypothetical protein